jgi:hypothetical protein
MNAFLDSPLEVILLPIFWGLGGNRPGYRFLEMETALAQVADVLPLFIG